jgi:hypothetical protein
MSLSSIARCAAGLVALVGIAGLAFQFTVSLEKSGTAPDALWAMLRFFTIIGNALTALVLLSAALGLRRIATPSRLGGVTLVMGLIGVIYTTLLRNIEHLTGNALIANYLLHYAVPLLIALFWLVFVPRGGLTRLDPLRWAILPLLYLPYAIARADADGKYAYPFINVAQLGWGQVAFNVAVIALGFVIVGLLLVWFDRKMAPTNHTVRPE